MSIAETILAVFGPDDALTIAQVVHRSGLSSCRVTTYLSRLRHAGQVERIGSSRPPVVYRLAGAARVRAELLARAPIPAPDGHSESILGRALRTQAPSVFHLGRFS